MLDVHPPEHAAHSWSDFFIHIATIVIGLLIAIGLEQTVEAIHHHHQRHQLLEALHRECEDNIEILTSHLDVNIPNMLWYRRALAQVRSAPVIAGNIAITLPPADPSAPHHTLFAPERNVWPSARAAGTVALLRDDEAQAFATVDNQAEQDEKQVDLIRTASARLTQWEFETGQKVVPAAKLNITLDQRKDLTVALAEQCQQLYDLLHRDNIFLSNVQHTRDGDYHVSQLFQGTRHPLHCA
jgi:hypothetical protein